MSYSICVCYLLILLVLHFVSASLNLDNNCVLLLTTTFKIIVI